ncbi:MAG: hypothetical protein AUH77_11325 [Candidatus Rokubacteria bacterium 13_1_40CM_4_69_39]|nr:MAG: hypothetical protein AUH77_11325 [Candidatus Rokubacteria bacterium 13_1_40CM_4_69_39]
MSESLGVAVAFSSGLFSFLSPCVLPLFPSYLSFITGMSVADLTADLSGAVRWRILGHALAFVVGFSIVFVALGASFGAAGQTVTGTGALPAKSVPASQAPVRSSAMIVRAIGPPTIARVDGRFTECEGILSVFWGP